MDNTDDELPGDDDLTDLAPVVEKPDDTRAMRILWCVLVLVAVLAAGKVVAELIEFGQELGAW